MPRIRKFRVVAVAVPAALLILAGTAWADPLLVESMGLDVWEIGRLEDDLKRSNRETTRLETEMVNIQELTILNEMTFQDVIAGHTEISAAAKRKWEANKHRPAVREHLSLNRKGATYEERTAHDLYIRAYHESADRPDHAAVCERLRREFFAAYGVVPEHARS